MSSQKTGILLINLGTPKSPNEQDVRVYLKEFLMDPLVIDIPYIFRWVLINLIILRNRPKNSALAYQKIWTTQGSPLLFNTLDLSQKVQNILGAGFHVIVGMRYGQPSIQNALKQFKSLGIEKIKALPLYPQYSLAASESCIQETKKQVLKYKIKDISFVPPFYSNDLFIESFANNGRAQILASKPDHILFSFHGIPERHVKKTDLTKSHCLKLENCCDQITQANKNCYRAQCFATAKLLADKLSLNPTQYTVCFQSRLGRTPWIKPYTDVAYGELVLKGKKRVLLFSPSFVADCLETLEEIVIRGRNDFRALGGEELWLVPSLNSSDQWAKAVTQMLQPQLIN
ncbi:MAG: ferrochelatase [Oligoflexia bacterium]|nr:ferrochelatase [Oligoflexia bacterium]